MSGVLVIIYSKCGSITLARQVLNEMARQRYYFEECDDTRACNAQAC
jgi:hypothetical protein